MTLQDVYASGVSGDAFRCYYALEGQGGDYSGGISGLAEILSWSDRKTSRVLKELEGANIVRVERRYKAPSRISICGASDRPAEIDRPAEPAPGNRSDGLRGSCSDSGLDSICTVQNSQSGSEAFDLPDLSGQRSALPGDADPYNLRPRLQAVSFIGTEWLLRTFSAEVIDGQLSVVEDLIRDGIAYNPGGLLNSALRGKCLLFRPEPLPETPQEPTSQVTFTAPEDPVEDVERRKELADASPYSELWEQIKAGLSSRIVRQSLQTWFEPCFILDVTPERVVLSAPTQFVAEWIQENYALLLRKLFGCEVEVVAGKKVKTAA